MPPMHDDHVRTPAGIGSGSNGLAGMHQAWSHLHNFDEPQSSALIGNRMQLTATNSEGATISGVTAADSKESSQNRREVCRGSDCTRAGWARLSRGFKGVQQQAPKRGMW